ncbi:MAG: 4-alpha-glucanotransferase [Verrucomicrobiota bacterium]
MQIVFRLNYHTVPGQSLWVKLATVSPDLQARYEQLLPLRWSNDQQWELALDVQSGGPLRLEYSYQLRQDDNGLVLDEWAGPRQAVADPATLEALLLLDTWCSAGTVDYAYETHAFQAVLPARGRFATPTVEPGANHLFQLRMAAVPAGRVPCLLGGPAGLGAWAWPHAIPLHEVSANVWQAGLALPQDQRLEYKYGLMDPTSGSAVSLEAGDNRVLDARGLAERQRTRVSDEGYRREAAALYHAAGVAIPVFSLRSDLSLGVGEFADLKLLADWAHAVGLKLIQILPVNDTTAAHDWQDSYPYSAISVFALHPLYLRIEDLGCTMPAEFAADLDASREWLNALEHVDYPEVMRAKTALTRRVFALHHAALTTAAGFLAFLAENRQWLVPYAAFCLQRDHFGTADFTRWQDWQTFDLARVDAMAGPDHPAWPELSYHIWLQYELDRQLSDAVAHLRRKGIILKGDLPIGIDRHSVDAWSAPHLFQLDAQAGAPPDAFAAKGQNWGFPTYNWDAMRADGYAWWRARLAHLSHHFDAYRIDHILGFFRIWQIPTDQVEGIMGWFDPAVPVALEEILGRDIPFDFSRYCRPFIREAFLWERFGDAASQAKQDYLDDLGGGVYQLRDRVATQHRIAGHFAGLEPGDAPARLRLERLRAGLLDCASDVLFFEVPGSNGTLFHPRCLMQLTRSFQELDGDVKWRMEELYVDYFYRRQDAFWQARGYDKLPGLRRASPMLWCGEDLGMVPACVPRVLHELGILSLEIQRMPKRSDAEFGDPAHAPYLSVVSTSTHDMPSLRGWWGEDPRLTANFAWQMLGEASPPPELSGALAARILLQHLQSPAMWAIFPLQDLLASDESIRHPDPAAERINVPAVRHHRWCYRMHLDLAELAAADRFNGDLARMIRASGRGDGPDATSNP